MMIEEIWQTYVNGDYLSTLSQSATELLKCSGIDLLAASGLSLLHLRRVPEGVLLLKAAATFRPDLPALYQIVAEAMQDLVLVDELDYFVTLGLRDFPDDPVVKRFIGSVYLLKMEYDKALAFFKAQLDDNPQDFQAHLNLASIYRLLSQFDHAERHYAAGEAISPGHPKLVLNRASMLFTQGRHADACAAVSNMQDHPDVQYLLALDALASGDYPTGWRLNLNRWDSLTFKTSTKPPRQFYDLAEVRGQRVAVMREGGYGDMIMMMRYFPMLAAIASEVLIYAAPGEVRLLQSFLPANVILRTTNEPPDGYDRCTALFDLPYHFQTTLDTIPPPPRLTIKTTGRRLPPTRKKRVGLTWAGGSQDGINGRAYNNRRSIALSQLASLGSLCDQIEFVSLQAGPHAADEGFPMMMTTALRPDDDWIDTAAIVRQLDLVISVDTAVAHLAATLGTPTWLLSRIDPCWRWLRNQADSPWYRETVRVFGQTTYDDWSPVVTEVVAALSTWLESAE